MTSFKEALDQDLQRAGIDRKALAEALKISVQAVGKWVAASAIPSARRAEVAQILGADAQVLQLEGTWHLHAKENRGHIAPVEQVQSVSRKLHDRLTLAAFLEPKMAMHVDKPVRFGASGRRFDYLSSRVCLEIVHARHFFFRGEEKSSWTRLPTSARLALLSLALVKEVVHSTEAAPLERTVVLLPDEKPISPVEMARFTAEAALLDISVVVLDSMRAVAEYIKEIENSSSLSSRRLAEPSSESSDSDDTWHDAL